MQAVLTVVVLLALPSPVRSSMPLVVAVLVAVAIAVALVGRARPADGRSRWARVRRAVAGDVRGGLLARRAWPAIVLASALVVVGHAITFVVAARTAGADAPLSELLPLALLAMLAMVLPSVAGWGPREGATAWAFAAAGLGADLGVATAVVYGVMVLVASLPGALVLVAAVAPRRAVRPPGRSVVARPEGAADALTARTPCFPAASRSTATSRARRRGCCCRTRPTSTGSTPFAPPATRSWSARRRCGTTTRGSLVRSPGAPRRPHCPWARAVADEGDGDPRAELDARADFFTAGEAEKLVYCARPRVGDARERLGPVATVVDAGDTVEMCGLSNDLAARGVERLMVEGGGTVHTQFLTDDLVDELQLVVAPVFVGDSHAPRFVRDGCFPWNPARRATLAEVRQIGDVVLLRYALSSRFEDD